MALVAVEAGSGRPCPRDTRELVPVEAGSTNPLMGRLLEENKILKQRLELLEMGSRRPALGDLGPLHSPVSFASDGLRGQTVQNRSVRTVSDGRREGVGLGADLLHSNLPEIRYAWEEEQPWQAWTWIGQTIPRLFKG